jgi:hypothetical protein
MSPFVIFVFVRVCATWSGNPPVVGLGTVVSWCTGACAGAEHGAVRAWRGVGRVTGFARRRTGVQPRDRRETRPRRETTRSRHDPSTVTET